MGREGTQNIAVHISHVFFPLTLSLSDRFSLVMKGWLLVSWGVRYGAEELFLPFCLELVAPVQLANGWLAGV